MCAFLHFILVVLLAKSGGSDNAKDEASMDEDDVNNFVTLLRSDAYLDLPQDPDYEDLRAELLAAHTVLHTLREEEREDTRKSLVTKPCWEQGGICVPYELCQGSKFLTQVRGCMNKLNVCCFRWNKYIMRDLRDKGAGFGGYPWTSNPSYYLNKYNRKPGDWRKEEDDKFKQKKKRNRNKKATLDNSENKKLSMLGTEVQNDFKEDDYDGVDANREIQGILDNLGRL